MTKTSKAHAAKAKLRIFAQHKKQPRERERVLIDSLPFWHLLDSRGRQDRRRSEAATRGAVKPAVPRALMCQQQSPGFLYSSSSHSHLSPARGPWLTYATSLSLSFPSFKTRASRVHSYHKEFVSSAHHGAWQGPVPEKYYHYQPVSPN